MRVGVVVRLAPEMKAAIERTRMSAEKMIDAYRDLAAAGNKASEDVAKACECLRVEQRLQSIEFASSGTRSQIKRFKERRRFPVPRSQKGK